MAKDYIVWGREDPATGDLETTRSPSELVSIVVLAALAADPAVTYLAIFHESDSSFTYLKTDGRVST